MIRTINLLKIGYASGYFSATEQIEKPLNIGITAKTGDGKSYLVKAFANANEGIYLLSQMDITANQFRETVGDFKSYYMIIYDDIRFRDDRTKKTILSQITSITDMEFNFVQEGGDTSEVIKASNLLSFNKDQVKSMDKVITTLGLKSRLLRHRWKLPRGLYKEIKNAEVPKYADLHVNLQDIKYRELICVNPAFERYLTDFRNIEHVEILYNVGKALGFSDTTLLDLLDFDIIWNLDYWKKVKKNE